MDRHGYVTATVPATSPDGDVPVIGFIAHVDTSPEMPGAGVKPIVHPNYDGRDLCSCRTTCTVVLRAADIPALAERTGDDIVTASGTTLLGADNKAGVAEIMTAVEYLLAHPDIPHGRIRVAFTPDEEIGRGTLHFDVAAFGARMRLHDGWRQPWGTRVRELLGRCHDHHLHRLQHPPGLCPGAHGECDQGRGLVHRSAAEGHVVTGNHRGLRGVRASIHHAGRSRPRVGALHRPRFP